MRTTVIIIAMSIVIFSVSTLSAQPTGLMPDRGTSVGVEFLKPFFVNSNSSSTTSVLFINGRYSMSQSITIVADLPFAYHGYKDNFGLDGFESSTVVGNPYLGMEIGIGNLPLFAEVGIRLPLSTDRDEFYEESRASIVGQFTDPDRFDAFELYGFSGTVRLNYFQKLASGFLLQLHSGLSGAFSPDQDYGPAGFSTLDYGFQLGYQVKQVGIIGGFSGRYLLGGHTFHMSRFGRRDRTAQQIAVAASLKLAAVHPGLYFRLPIDDFLNDEINFVLGANLGIPL